MPSLPSGPGKPKAQSPSRHAARIWAALPPKARLPLLFSGSGDAHLMPALNELAEHLGRQPEAGPLLLPVLQDLALHVWELGPFSPHSASILLMLHGQKPFLRPTAVTLCKMGKHLKPGDAALARRVQELFLDGEPDAIKPALEKARRAEPGNVFWLYFASFLGLRMGELDWYEPWLEASALPLSLALYLKADVLFARGEYARAAELYAEGHALLGMPEMLIRQGECRLRLKEEEEAARCWKEAFTARPWQINLLLRLTDLMARRHLPGEHPEGRGRILLYSWNHGNDLEKTLASVAASDLGHAGISVLDNGSSDQSPGIISAWRERLGERMRVVTLPVNVGAPAARNWLLKTEEALAANWVVFLDDDALVPPDWLRLLGAATRERPEARIIGCRVVDQPAPLVLQSVDLHLAPLFDEAGNLAVEAHMAMIESHRSGADFGQFSYRRPALSVTGCCHLITRKGMDETGGFDLRFSPSQFDDLERDLRADDQQSLCYYQGHLVVRHMKRTGSSRGMSAWQMANVEGNLKKLMLSYPPERLGQALRRDVERQEAFLEQKLEEMQGVD